MMETMLIKKTNTVMRNVLEVFNLAQLQKDAIYKNLFTLVQ